MHPDKTDQPFLPYQPFQGDMETVVLLDVLWSLEKGFVDRDVTTNHSHIKEILTDQ